MIYNIFINIIFIYIFTTKIKSLIIPFETETSSNNNNNNYILNNLNNSIFITLQLSEPIQNIKFYLKLEDFFTYISKSDNFKESKYFSSFGSNYTFNKKNYLKGKKSSDMIYINKNYYNFTFIYMTEFIKEENVIGLRLQDNINYDNEFNFILKLKKKNIINEYIFYIEYFDEFKGNFIIGKYPHEINKKIYKNNFIYNKVTKINNKILWGIYFDTIFFDNFYFKEKNVLIKYEFGFIKGIKRLYVYLKENYFKNYFEKKFCNETIYENYTFFICKKRLFSYKYFPNFYFNIKNLNYSFILDNNDLFKVENDLIYFLICFNINDTNDNWIFGKPFLKKNILLFDIDKKIIGFYNNKLKFDKKNNLKLIFLNVVLFVIIFVLIFVILKLIFKISSNRKIRANELEENVIYKTLIK